MQEPPDLDGTTEPNPRANGETEHGEGSVYLSPKTVAREAAKVSRDMDLRISPARLRILVRRFLEDGRADIDFRTWFTTYADPTGEAASRAARHFDPDGARQRAREQERREDVERTRGLAR